MTETVFSYAGSALGALGFRTIISNLHPNTLGTLEVQGNVGNGTIGDRLFQHATSAFLLLI